MLLYYFFFIYILCKHNQSNVKSVGEPAMGCDQADFWPVSIILGEKVFFIFSWKNVIFYEKSAPFSFWRLLCYTKKFVSQSRCSLLKCRSYWKGFFLQKQNFNRKFAVSCYIQQATLLPLPLKRVVSYRTCTSAQPCQCCGFISTFSYFKMFS